MRRQRTYAEAAAAAAPFLPFPPFFGDFFPPAFLAGLFRFFAPPAPFGRPAFLAFFAAGPPPPVAARFGFGEVDAFGLAAGLARGVLRVLAEAPLALPFGRPRPFFDGDG